MGAINYSKNRERLLRAERSSDAGSNRSRSPPQTVNHQKAQSLQVP